MTKPNFPGCVDAPATMIPRGWKSGRNRSSTSASDAARARRRRRRCGSRSISTSASTAIGTPPRTISGFRSTDATSGRSCASRDRPSSTRASASRSSAGSPRNGPSSARVASRSGSARAPASSSGTDANTTSRSASASTPPTPSITHGPNCGSRTRPAISSREPRTCSATSRPTRPSSGRAFASSSAAAPRTASPSRSPSRTRSRSVLCAIASPHSFTTTGKPSCAAAARASAAVDTSCSAAIGTPNSASSSLEACSERVVAARGADIRRARYATRVYPARRVARTETPWRSQSSASSAYGRGSTISPRRRPRSSPESSRRGGTARCGSPRPSGAIRSR